SIGILKLLLKINERGTTVLMATHDQSIVDRFQKRVVLIEEGKILADITKGGYQDAIKGYQIFRKGSSAQY
ncbi:hypothetical protein KKB99_00200, partial [bacterium]|nr:hypothetical protein [bacterium]MBU1024405.1 hypothetical protein [bacterium]